MKYRLAFVALLAVALLVLAAPAVAADQSYYATRYDVAATVEAGGDLLVTETVEYSFSGEPFTFVFRELETDYTDGFTIVEAAMDGQPLPAGTGPGQVEISGERVTWHMAPTVDESHTFTLTYRLHGVVRQGAAGDVLRFQILPTEHEFTIAASETTLQYPPGVRPVGEVEVIAGHGTVMQLEDGVSIYAQQLEPDTSLAIEVAFPAGSVIAEPPAWQVRQNAQRAQAPYWLAAGGLIAIVGIAAFGVAFLRLQPQAPTHSRYAAGSGRTYEPPADLPPAYAGALATAGGRAQWSHALATLFDLAEREIITIDEKPREGLFSSRDFVVRRLSTPADLKPHERALLDLLFEEGHGMADEVRFSKLQHKVTGKRWKAYQDTLWKEMKQEGLVSEARRAAGNRLTAVGVLVLLAGIVFFPLLFLLFDSGAAAVAVPFALLLTGLIGIILGQSVKPLTPQGVDVAAGWEAFARYLKEVSRGKAAKTRPDMFNLYLPYAAAFGLLYSWARHFAREGEASAPAWFHAATTDGSSSMAAFVAMSSSASSSGGSAAASGAAAGAAGGGAAGAG